MLITCLDPTLIPATWDLKIKNDFYRLRFEVEGQRPNTSPDVTMTTPEGNDDDPSGDGSGQSEENAKNRDAKRSKGAASMEINEDTNNKYMESDPNANKLAISPVHLGSVDVNKLKTTWSDYLVTNKADKNSNESRYSVSNFVDSYPSPKLLEPLFISAASLDSEQQVPAVRFPENFSTLQATSLVADVAVSSVIMDADTAPRGAVEVALLAGHAVVSILSSDTAASLSLQGTELHADEAAHRSQLGVAGWRHAQQHASMASEPVLGFGAPNAAGGQVQSAKHKFVPCSPKPILHG
jgi:hypothetical protein